LGNLPTSVRHPYAALLESLPRAADRALVKSIELPAIVTAWRHAMENESRELATLDQATLSNPDFTAHADISCKLGHEFINRLIPLRDARILQRHAKAVENGDAPGSHLIVFGLMLAVFSVPPRQAMLDYVQARQPDADSASAVISNLLDRAA
jgi:urease accessory protein UreF